MKTATTNQSVFGIADMKKEKSLQRLNRIKALLEWTYVDPEVIAEASAQIEKVVLLLELSQIKRGSE